MYFFDTDFTAMKGLGRICISQSGIYYCILFPHTFTSRLLFKSISATSLESLREIKLSTQLVVQARQTHTGNQGITEEHSFYSLRALSFQDCVGGWAKYLCTLDTLKFLDDVLNILLSSISVKNVQYMIQWYWDH